MGSFKRLPGRNSLKNPLLACLCAAASFAAGSALWPEAAASPERRFSASRLEAQPATQPATRVAEPAAAVPSATPAAAPQRRAASSSDGALWRRLPRSKHWRSFPVQRDAARAAKNILIIHDLFALSFNSDTRLPDWTAYQLSPSSVWGFLQEERRWRADPLLPAALSFSAGVYKGASSFGYDKGHLAPKGSFKGSPSAYQAQYMTNLVPQMRNLNQGPWRRLEEAVRRAVFAGSARSPGGRSVKVLAGPLYDGPALASWPAAQGVFPQIPSGYWKLVSIKEGGALQVCSFVMPQRISDRKTALKKLSVKRAEAERRSGLQFFEGYHGRIKDSCSFLL